MKPGQIWSQKADDGKTYGWKIIAFYPKAGYAQRDIAYLRRIKDPLGIAYALVLTDTGLPMLEDGTASSKWALIEDVPSELARSK